MEEKSVERRSKIVKALLVVVGISAVVMFINFFFWFSTPSGWEPAVENTFSFIHYSSMGLCLAATIGILIIVIIGRRKTR
jgi:Na+/alanine symporter